MEGGGVAWIYGFEYYFHFCSFLLGNIADINKNHAKGVQFHETLYQWWGFVIHTCTYGHLNPRSFHFWRRRNFATLQWRHNECDGVSNHQPQPFIQGKDQRKHQSSASLAFVREFTYRRWIPRTKGLKRGKCFPLMTSSWNTKYHYLFQCPHQLNRFKLSTPEKIGDCPCNTSRRSY